MAKDKDKPAKPTKTIGSVACDLIMAGKDNAQTLAGVKKAFPKAKTTLNSINWYRNDLKKKGKKVPALKKASAKAK